MKTEQEIRDVIRHVEGALAADPGMSAQHGFSLYHILSPIKDMLQWIVEDENNFAKILPALEAVDKARKANLN